jgi:uncharacterized protein
MLCQFSVKEGRRGTGFGVACHFKTGCRMSVVLAERDKWYGRETIARDAKRPASPAVQSGRCWLAFAWVLPIALLSGLIGLGGAECRLPLLAGPLRHSLRDAVPINLAVSLVTLVSALAVRLPFFSLAPLHPFVPAVAAVTLGAIVAVSAAGTAVSRLTETRFAQSVLGLLLLIGLVLLSAALLPPSVPAVVPETVSLQLMTGLALGLAVGIVSSLLGVAGGALLIPTLVFAYGLDIKTAGTTSLVISLPIVVIGIARFARFGAYQWQALRETVLPMAAGSIVGAMAGGFLVGLFPAPLLTGGLGALIIWSAWRTFAQTRSSGRAAVQRQSPGSGVSNEPPAATFFGD